MKERLSLDLEDYSLAAQKALVTKLRYESSTLILYKELSSSIFKVVSQRVSEASVIPDQISTLCNILRHKCPLLTQYNQSPTATTS